MKILWLFHFKLNNNYDHYLNVDFAYSIGQYPGVELMGYGSDLTEHHPKLAPMKYADNITMDDIYKVFPFDAVIVNTKGRCFEYYNPHTGVIKEPCLPKGFKEWKKTPKIMFEEDYHYEKDDSWYHEMGMDVILQRHYSQSLRQENVPMMFFPFSVDNKVFNITDTTVKYQHMTLLLASSNERDKKIAFVGNDGDKAYIYRFWAIRNLVKLNMGKNYSAAEKPFHRRVDGEYIQLLRQYIAHISCGSTFEICAAKNLEIMATGSVLFTNKFLGIDLLFPENSYVSYKNDWSDLVPKAKKILHEPEYVKEITTNALKCVNERHTHNHRIAELLEIIKNLK